MNYNASPIITEGNKRIALSLSWAALSGLKSVTEETFEIAVQFSGAANAKQAVCAKTNGENGDQLVGILQGHDKSILKGKEKLYSGALAFSLLPELSSNALLIMHLDDGQTWLVAVRKGQLDVSFDKLVPTADADFEVETYLQELPADATPTYYGNSDRFKGNTFDLSDLAFSCGKASELSSVGSGVIISKNMVLVFALIAVTGVVGMQKYNAHKKSEEARLLAAAQQVDPNQAYQANLIVAQQAAGTPVAPYFKLIEGVLDDIPAELGGWKLDSISCPITDGATPSCAVTWLEQGGTFESFISAYGKKPSSASFALDGTKIEHIITLPAIGKSLVDINHAPSMEHVLTSFGSRLQEAAKSGVQFKLAEVHPYGVPGGVDGMSIDRNVLISSGEWGYESNYLYKSFIESIPENFSINGVLVKVLEGNLKITVKGTYYVKN